MSTEALPVVFAIRWSSQWAGDVPAPRTVRAYLDRGAASSDPDLRKTTYDGVSARTQGSFDLVVMEPSARLLTLHQHGATFALTGNNEPGAWLAGRPAQSAYDPSKGDWNWKSEERLYLEALWAAQNPQAWETIHA